jgi:4-diphosphocytidyl-2-C-methyl-D-erythritol kinase
LFLSLQAPAKLNLGLHVLRKRQDGFHDLETVFVHIGWCDEITVKAASSLSLRCDDPLLDAEDGNLCLSAAEILRSRFGKEHGADIALNKRIPMGAGLGGGSSDAASTLILLNELWALGCSRKVLRELGAELGSDVPGFLFDSPTIATGRGERLAPLRDSGDEETLEIPYSFAVIKPDVFVSTADAYASITPNDVSRPDLDTLIRSLDLDRWNAELVNDFEVPVASRHPEIKKALLLLHEAGAGYAAMSGSGSAVYGVFERESDAADAARTAADHGLSAWSGTSYQPMRPF